MKSQLAYCSACEKDVQIVITDEPSQEGHANVHDAEIVCLAVDDHCTGHRCPVGATSPQVMIARLIRNGLSTVVQPIIEGHCSGCDRVTSHALMGADYMICSDCGTTSPRSALA